MEIKKIQNTVKGQIDDLQSSLDKKILISGEQKYKNGDCTVLSQSIEQFVFDVEKQKQPIAIWLNTRTDYNIEEDEIIETVSGIYPSTEEWDACSYACLLQTKELLELNPNPFLDHKQYSRKGMIQRVMEERWQKAFHAEYRIEWADNIYGDHILTNENGVKYKVFLRDFENETGYSNSKDSAVNKLGTTKHIMYAFRQLKNNEKLFKRLKKNYPFIEVYCDPLKNYNIRYFFPHDIYPDEKHLLDQYFNEEGYVEENNLSRLTEFFNHAQFYDRIHIRPEVGEKVGNFLEDKALQAIQRKYVPDFSSLNATLYDYQKEGISFAVCRKHAIIADEMGLGKTIQAIGIAVLKKELFGFTKTLVVCPASLKAQWKKEIEKFTGEKAVVVQGTPEERAIEYKKSDAYFLIVNYETVLRDQLALNHAKIDFLILDEAQKVKNYATKSASAIKNVGRKHVLIITGTPIENKLIDLFSIMTILDPHLLGPLWEFSYQYCLFDNQKQNKINAYYNLSKLKEELQPVLLRREKRKVIEELPNIQQQDVYVGMTPLQADYHASYASGIGQIINKKFLTAFDMQRLQQLLTAMRMVCDSTYLVDETTSDSPKLDELKYILFDKLDLKNQNRKVIIFSEWVKMHKLIGQMLLEEHVGFSELNGSIPVKKRGGLIKQFEDDENCKVFLSTEAGGAGLNLQVADILINFELPWNPAKKNQRIGRIDRLGQKSNKLTIFNLVTYDSIEQRIALGLLVKQNLFDSVLNEGNTGDFVDFTEKGRGQFLQQMKELAGDFEEQEADTGEMEPVAGVAEDVEGFTSGDIRKDQEDDDLVPYEEEAVKETVRAQKEENEPVPVPVEENYTAQQEVAGQVEATGDKNKAASTEPAVQMEQVLNNGMQFLSGLMQMATGKNIGIKDQKIEVNKETGEVTMKFKLPTF